jgi:hypothetical protein
MGHRREQNAQNAASATEADGYSRRTVVAGSVATAAVAAVMPLGNAAHADGPDVNSKQDMMAFVLLSEALTGVNKLILAPELSGSDPGTDPINIKNSYFTWINAKDKTSSFTTMLAFVKDNPKSSPEDIVGFINENKDINVQFLGRSIILLWYLGSWYDPGELQKRATRNDQTRVPSEVVSAKAYTQGLVWQIAGAHPMGYSNLQFGYWSRDPRDPNDPNPLLPPPKNP